jgi:hypothetical protein
MMDVTVATVLLLPGLTAISSFYCKTYWLQWNKLHKGTTNPPFALCSEHKRKNMAPVRYRAATVKYGIELKPTLHETTVSPQPSRMRFISLCLRRTKQKHTLTQIILAVNRPVVNT